MQRRSPLKPPATQPCLGSGSGPRVNYRNTLTIPSHYTTQPCHLPLFPTPPLPTASLSYRSRLSYTKPLPADLSLPSLPGGCNSKNLKPSNPISVWHSFTPPSFQSLEYAQLVLALFRQSYLPGVHTRPRASLIESRWPVNCLAMPPTPS